MASLSKPRYPSDSRRYPSVFIQLPITRRPERLHVVLAAKRLARARKETQVSFFMRALSREVLRCRPDLRSAADDLLEFEVLALLSEEKKAWGL
jgi:hypothetical protein